MPNDFEQITVLCRPQRRVALVAAFAVLLCCLPSAFAQLGGKGEVKGTVKDAMGAVVPNATLTATENSTGVHVVRKTNSAGDYDLSPLDPGIYTIVVTAAGFETETQIDVHVNALEIQDYNPVLRVGAATENITVTSAPLMLETSNATLGATMENDMYSALPLQMGGYGQPDQRRATDFAYLMPGVQGNETNGNATTNTGVVNGSGSRGAATAVYIDGVPFTQVSGEGDPRFVWTAISVDAVNQFQVETSGYSRCTKDRVFRTTPSNKAATSFTAQFTTTSATPPSIPGDSSHLATSILRSVTPPSPKSTRMNTALR
jgi:hypothetical protein